MERVVNFEVRVQIKSGKPTEKTSELNLEELA